MPGWVSFQSATLGQFCIGGNKAEVDHNRTIEIEVAETADVASFAGPPKKEVDVIRAEFSASVQILISCKKYSTPAPPADVQEWADVVTTMNRFSRETRFLGLVVSPSGFGSGCEAWALSHNLGLIPPLKGKKFKFPQASSIGMCRRVLGALSKRVAFPYGELFAAPGFYDFVFDLTADFEGRVRDTWTRGHARMQKKHRRRSLCLLRFAPTRSRSEAQECW